MDYLPAFHKVAGKLCLVVGGGEVGSRKAGVLLEAGALVRVVAPEIDAELLAHKNVTAIISRFAPEHLEGVMLAVAATDDREVNQQVSELAQAQNLPVNVVDDPELCSFIMPSFLDRSPLMIAFSSGGGSPVLTRMMRSKLESVLPQNYARLGDFAVRFRELVKQRVTNPPKRRIFWENALDGLVSEKVLAGDEVGAEALLKQMLDDEDNVLQGEVYLVGAGPGDPDLLTVKAARLISRADAIVYDHLVGKGIMDLARSDARLIYAGKESSKHTMPQDSINHLLVDLAKEGLAVVRLKGGDPFIFGRGGEEAQALAAEGIPFTVIPGLTAAQGAAASVGIPLTHRDHAASLVLATGHLRDGQGLDMDWAMLARPRQTVVLYMGVNNLPEICRQLVAHGLPGDTPAALVEKATLPDERCITGTVAELPSLALRHQVRPPALIMIGSVVSVRAQLMPATAPAEAEAAADTALHAAA